LEDPDQASEPANGNPQVMDKFWILISPRSFPAFLYNAELLPQQLLQYVGTCPLITF
jgi:hypothetical protein